MTASRRTCLFWEGMKSERTEWIRRLLHSIKNLAPIRRAATCLIGIEAAWFDLTRNVQTSGIAFLNELTLVGKQIGYGYIATRPSVARRVLRDLDLPDASTFTFIDCGSGMGRMLFLAAEYPFCEIHGVEFSKELHAKAEQNIAAVRASRLKCSRIESHLMEVTDYTFPPGNLVVYFFNPFGPEVMEPILDQLESALEARPRDVRIVLVFPSCAFLMDGRKHFSLQKQSGCYIIYRSVQLSAIR